MKGDLARIFPRSENSAASSSYFLARFLGASKFAKDVSRVVGSSSE